MEEIRLGQLAQTKGTNDEIKNLGKMIETAHNQAQNELQALAAKKQISLPTSPTDNVLDAYKKLQDKKGTDFDKEFSDMMVSGHKDAISKFEKASTDAADADIRSWATSMLSGLRSHLDHSMNCQSKLDKM